MELPKEAIHEFINIYKKKFGIKLSFEVAQIEAVNFLELMALITNKSINSNK